MIDECPLCGSGLERRTVVDIVRVRTRSREVESSPLVCLSCGEGYYGPGEMGDRLQEAANALRRELGLLLPSDIRALRLRLGLTQLEFERLLGVGRKTVVRWERGTISHNKATDTLLRVIAHDPKVVDFLRENAGLVPATRVADGHSQVIAFPLADVSAVGRQRTPPAAPSGTAPKRNRRARVPSEPRG